MGLPTRQAEEALQRLRDGNERFRSGTSQVRSGPCDPSRRPFALIVGCADGRVPPELVFDQGTGDLFVVRVAGNVTSPEVLGSVEVAIELFGIPLVVALGHSRCAAVEVTLRGILDVQTPSSPNVRAIRELVTPALTPLLPEGTRFSDDLFARAIHANVERTVRSLRETLDATEQGRHVAVVGAEYFLETGTVVFLEA